MDHLPPIRIPPRTTRLRIKPIDSPISFNNYNPIIPSPILARRKSHSIFLVRLHKIRAQRTRPQSPCPIIPPSECNPLGLQSLHPSHIHPSRHQRRNILHHPRYQINIQHPQASHLPVNSRILASHAMATFSHSLLCTNQICDLAT